MVKILFLRSGIDLTKNLTIGPSYEVLIKILFNLRSVHNYHKNLDKKGFMGMRRIQRWKIFKSMTLHSWVSEVKSLTFFVCLFPFFSNSKIQIQNSNSIFKFQIQKIHQPKKVNGKVKNHFCRSISVDSSPSLSKPNKRKKASRKITLLDFEPLNPQTHKKKKTNLRTKGWISADRGKNATLTRTVPRSTPSRLRGICPPGPRFHLWLNRVVRSQ